MTSISRYDNPRDRTRTSKRMSISPHPSDQQPSRSHRIARLPFSRHLRRHSIWLETPFCRKGKTTGGRGRRRTLIDQREQGIRDIEVYVLDTLDIDWQSTFDDPDAVLQCQWRRQRFEYRNCSNLQDVFANSRDFGALHGAKRNSFVKSLQSVCVFKFTLAFV